MGFGLVLHKLGRSRKFWLTVIALVQVVVSHYGEVPEEIWQAVTVVIMYLVGVIGAVDMAEALRQPAPPPDEPRDGMEVS